MRDAHLGLPLFQWQPPCVVIAYPLPRRVGKVRDVARKLLAKSTDRHADQYRSQVTEALSRQMEKYGIPAAERDIQISRFWQAVEAERTRISMMTSSHGGAA